MRHGKAAAILAVLASLALSTCGGAARIPSEQAVDRLEALAEAHAGDSSLVVRLNPVPCDCPEWEVLLDDAWHRAFLEPKDPEGPVEALRTRLSGSPSGAPAPGVVPPATARVAGRLSGSARLSGNRVPCLVLKVVQLCADEGCAPAD
jgi:hypothetical protein